MAANQAHMHLPAEWRETVEFLATPEAYSTPIKTVETIDTSISTVFLAGERAYKIRKPVDFGFLDFTTLEKRREDCEREIRLNRRIAPALYLRTIAITRNAAGVLALGGDGKPVEWAVEMRRFDSELMLDAQARTHTLSLPTIDVLATRIARFHESLLPETDWGGAASFRKTLLLNDGQLRKFAGKVFDSGAITRLRDISLDLLERHTALLDARKQDGWVRHCHGDLHLANICCLDGEPTPFDCIEFSDRIARVDVVYDLAFLLMDLQRHDLPTHANRCLNQYAAHVPLGSADALMAGLALLPLFQSCRAAIRAFVLAQTAQSYAAQSHPDTSQITANARAYFSQALAFLRPAPARLIAVGGFSGSGKSVLARGLAPEAGPAPGAIILRSDEIRKQLWGLPPNAPLPAQAYSSAVNSRVYDTLYKRTRTALAAGHSVVADAVNARETERDTLAGIARKAGVKFDGLWLDAPPDVLTARVEARRDDASDATAAVVRRQLGYDTGALSWRRLDASGTPQQVLADARQLIQTAG